MPSNLGKERIICTHTMIVLVQLSQCLFHGLAEQHCLIALQQQVKDENDFMENMTNMKLLCL
jgi:hypothetical protein